MKKLNIILLLLVLSTGANAQYWENSRTYAVGVRAAHLYDLPSFTEKTDLSGDVNNLSLDLAIDLYGEVRFNRWAGLQAGVRAGKLSGADEVETYRNNFWEAYLDLLTVLAETGFGRNSGINLYGKLGLGHGQYEAKRHLLSDDSFNGSLTNYFWDGHLGVGTQLKISSSIRIELDIAYNMPFDDGFDGFDYRTGTDHYLSTGMGLAYTFGD